MYIGGSLFLIAIGAILRWAVADTIDAIDLVMAGTILMVVGALGLVVSLFQQLMWRDREVRHEHREVY
jgi:Co/Zn/Cd efflux system component